MGTDIVDSYYHLLIQIAHLELHYLKLFPVLLVKGTSYVLTRCDMRQNRWCFAEIFKCILLKENVLHSVLILLECALKDSILE